MVNEETEEKLFECDVCDFGEGTDVEFADMGVLSIRIRWELFSI